MLIFDNAFVFWAQNTRHQIGCYHRPTCPSYLRAMTRPCDPWSTGTLRLVTSGCTLIRTPRGMTPAAASRNRKLVNSSVRIGNAKLKNRLRPGVRSQDTCDTSCENGTSTIGLRHCHPIWRIPQHCGRKSALYWINRMRNLIVSSRRTSSLTTFETRSAKSVSQLPTRNHRWFEADPVQCYRTSDQCQQRRSLRSSAAPRRNTVQWIQLQRGSSSVWFRIWLRQSRICATCHSPKESFRIASRMRLFGQD